MSTNEVPLHPAWFLEGQGHLQTCRIGLRCKRQACLGQLISLGRQQVAGAQLPRVLHSIDGAGQVHAGLA